MKKITIFPDHEQVKYEGDIKPVDLVKARAIFSDSLNVRFEELMEGDISEEDAIAVMKEIMSLMEEEVGKNA